MPEFLQAILPFYAYCENYTSYLEQPFNFITCAFFWVGVSILLSQHSEDDQSPSIHEIMAGMLFVLGITGAVWHATGNQIALGLGGELFSTFPICWFEPGGKTPEQRFLP